MYKEFLMTHQMLRFPFYFPIFTLSLNLGPFQTTNMDRPGQSLGTLDVWETATFLGLNGTKSVIQCKMKPARSCTFWRYSPQKGGEGREGERGKGKGMGGGDRKEWEEKEKKDFRVSTWQGQMESLSWNSGTLKDCSSQVFHYWWKQLGNVWKLPLQLFKCNANTQKRKHTCKTWISIKSRCVCMHCCSSKTAFSAWNNLPHYFKNVYPSGQSPNKCQWLLLNKTYKHVHI